jgi:tetratricopeptide (TPR) repeat protein
MSSHWGRGASGFESLPLNMNRLGEIVLRYGVTQMELGRLEAAESNFKRALLFIGGNAKTQARYDPLAKLGALKYRQKDYAAAVKYLGEAKAVLEKTIGLDNRFAADTMRLLWLAYLGDNKIAEADAIEAQANALNEKYPRK